MPNKITDFFFKLEFLRWKNGICTHQASNFLRRCCFILTYLGSISLLCHCKQLSSFYWLHGLLHHQREAVEPLTKVGVLFLVQATQNNAGEGNEGLPHFFREITSPFLTVQTISTVLEIHWKMNAMTNTEKHLSFQPKDFFIFQKNPPEFFTENIQIFQAVLFVKN